MPQHLERRQQPANPLKAMKLAILEIDWSIKEVTSHRFIASNGKWTNESFGYRLVVPKSLPDIRHLWVGYVKHQDTTPGFYSGLTAGSTEVIMKALRSGYRESPFKHPPFLKPLIHVSELRKMEAKLGIDQIKKRLKEMLVKIYPFNIK